ncbi:hypothetical protein [Actinomadura fibrosa]|uniref:Integral membrane protein n=1 Tax=Actinomadura fibrosa TaxID=111802 RepID=A0ABW2XCH4_9ACTN|nr:hypothetical protein [Actinomadura fibrosa]
MSTLEDRYRRLLAWYPAAHRAVHEREMLDVLLSAARPGQTRPSPADTADLLTGAIRIRLRNAASGDGPSAWPAGLAVAGFLAMLQLLADGVRFAADIPAMASLAAHAPRAWSTPHVLAAHFGSGPYWLAWAAIAVLAWRGRRRAAARAACAVTGAQIVLAGYGEVFDDRVFGSLAASTAGTALPLALLATASLVASPGPRHGARVLGRAPVACAAATAAVLAAISCRQAFTLLFRYPLTSTDVPADRFLHDVAGWGRLQLAGVLVAAVLAVAVLARTRETRRACALLAIAAVPAIGLLAVQAAGSPGETLPMELNGLVNDDGGVVPSYSITYGLVGFALAMLCVRLVEMPSRSRTHSEQTLS